MHSCWVHARTAFLTIFEQINNEFDPQFLADCYIGSGSSVGKASDEFILFILFSSECVSSSPSHFKTF